MIEFNYDYIFLSFKIIINKYTLSCYYFYFSLFLIIVFFINEVRLCSRLSSFALFLLKFVLMNPSDALRIVRRKSFDPLNAILINPSQETSLKFLTYPHHRVKSLLPRSSHNMSPLLLLLLLLPLIFPSAENFNLNE